MWVFLFVVLWIAATYYEKKNEHEAMKDEKKMLEDSHKMLMQHKLYFRTQLYGKEKAELLSCLEEIAYRKSRGELK